MGPNNNFFRVDPFIISYATEYKFNSNNIKIAKKNF